MESIVPIFHSLSKSLRKIHKAGCNEVSIVQSSILQEIAMLTMPSMQEVALAVGMDITTFSRQIGTLEKKGLVFKKPNDKDRRIYILSLTDKGEEVIKTINRIIAVKMEQSLSSMNDFERETVIRSMHVLEKKLRGISDEIIED